MFLHLVRTIENTADAGIRQICASSLLRWLLGLVGGLILMGIGQTLFAVRWGGQIETRVESIFRQLEHIDQNNTHAGQSSYAEIAREMAAVAQTITGLERRVTESEKRIESAREFVDTYLHQLERRLASIEAQLGRALAKP